MKKKKSNKIAQTAKSIKFYLFIVKLHIDGRKLLPRNSQKIQIECFYVKIPSFSSCIRIFIIYICKKFQSLTLKIINKFTAAVLYLGKKQQFFENNT